MSQEGDLYFANVEERDSRSDYCCFAAFPKLRTIVQKMPMKLTVNSCKSRERAVRSQCRMQPCRYHPGAKAGRSWVGIFCPCLVQLKSPPPDEMCAAADRRRLSIAARKADLSSQYECVSFEVCRSSHFQRASAHQESRVFQASLRLPLTVVVDKPAGLKWGERHSQKKKKQQHSSYQSHQAVLSTLKRQLELLLSPHDSAHASLGSQMGKRHGEKGQ